MLSSKLESFDRVDFDFKSIHGHGLKTSILHGGGFIVGDHLYEGWLPVWLLDVFLTNSTIFIAPDYRLLPEAIAAEVLDDAEDFWPWLHDTLPKLTMTWNAFPDLTRLACTGQSAGGYLAVQSALLFHELSRIKLVASMGGSLNTDIPHWRIPGPMVILGERPPTPGKAESIVRKYVRNIKPQTVRTSGNVVEMWDFLTCVLQQAYLACWLGAKEKEELDVMKVLERAKAMPPSSPLCSIDFVKKSKQTLSDIPVLLYIQPGDHGFEAMHDRKDQWIQAGVEFIRKYWP